MPLQQPEGVKVTSLYYEVVSNGRVDFPAGAPIGRLQNSCPRDKFAQPFPGRTRLRVQETAGGRAYAFTYETRRFIVSISIETELRSARTTNYYTPQLILCQ